MAKTEATPIHRTCGTMEVHERLLRTDPAYVRNRVASENNHFHAALRGGAGLRTGVTVIPVVVHVIWKTNAQNISDAQIQSQIDVLNHDYRKTNSDIGSIPSVFAPLAADARIEFELASTDPNGNATNGITRDKTTKDSFVDDDGVKHASSGGSNAWDSTKYLNLWVCQLGNNLLGYAQFPGGAAATDGVVILHSGFGTSGTAAAPFNLGRTATHEVGHWLNLRHIWGDDGGGCNGDDFIADTPNCADHNFGKPGFPHVTCNNGPNGDMFMNYMDYTDDDSMFMFTIDQVTRMQACLDGDRASIGHQKPGPKLKFADDPKMKFVDDPKFKFVDDPINTLKFKDDPKLKFADDPKFKFVDDPINTLKFRDDPKLKFADDPIQTFGGGDDPNWPGPVGPDPAPFVLATPHHSTAWSRSYPGAHAQSLAAYEQQLRELEGQLAAYQQAQAAGALSAQEAADAEALFQAYARLAEEYRQLGGQ